MQSHPSDLTCTTVEHSGTEETYSSIEQALFAVVELANDNEPCCPMCGTDAAPDQIVTAPERIARGTEQVSVVTSPEPEVGEICEPEIVFTAKPERAKNRASFAVGALLMAAGTQFLVASLNLPF